MGLECIGVDRLYCGVLKVVFWIVDWWIDSLSVGGVDCLVVKMGGIENLCDVVVWEFFVVFRFELCGVKCGGRWNVVVVEEWEVGLGEE